MGLVPNTEMITPRLRVAEVMKSTCWGEPQLQSSCVSFFERRVILSGMIYRPELVVPDLHNLKLPVIMDGDVYVLPDKV